jgi:hypothetical protein
MLSDGGNGGVKRWWWVMADTEAYICRETSMTDHTTGDGLGNEMVWEVRRLSHPQVASVRGMACNG